VSGLAPHRPLAYDPSGLLARSTSVGAVVGAAFVVALMLLTLLPAGAAHPTATPSSAVPGASRPAAASAAAPTDPVPTAGPAAFNPPCAPVTSGVCVAIANSTETEIVPHPPSYYASVEPPATESLPLWVKSAKPLNWTYNAHSGPDSPIALNVTGTLWNGEPYYSTYDGTTYHSSQTAWWSGPQIEPDPTYPYWYLVNMSSQSLTGQQSFFPGMSISWWIEITYNVSGSYFHNFSPVYHFTYSGAWPSSPYPGSSQYGGSSAFLNDLTVAVIPGQPNWNDSLSLSLSTVQADLTVNASINQIYLDLTETTANGTEIAAATLTNSPANGTLGIGFPKLGLIIPAAYDQDAGATVRYTLHASDAWGDWITSAERSYVVNGNGSFLGGSFANDLALAASPGVDQAAAVAPGTPVALTLTSEEPEVAIASATVFYTVALPVLNEVASFSAPFARINSTTFTGVIPGVPVGSGVNFTVTAWDFSSTAETSPDYNYTVEALATVLPNIADNSSFFYIGVHDASSNSWVSGARVAIEGPGNYISSVSTSFAGLAYPGQTGGSYVPIVVPAGATYAINVSDPALGFPGIAVSLVPTHAMGQHSILASGTNYAVLQEGNLLLFWLNGTIAPAAGATPDVSPIILGSVLGLVAATLVTIPLLGWWSRIVKRREEETRRVTL
jgi:hypothetical protein